MTGARYNMHYWNHPGLLPAPPPRKKSELEHEPLSCTELIYNDLKLVRAESK